MQPRVRGDHRACNPWEGATVQRTTLDDVSQPDRHGVKTRVILSAVSGRETGRGERQGGGPVPGLPVRRAGRRWLPPIFTLRRRVAFIRQLRSQLPLRSAVNWSFTT